MKDNTLEQLGLEIYKLSCLIHAMKIPFPDPAIVDTLRG